MPSSTPSAFRKWAKALFFAFLLGCTILGLLVGLFAAAEGAAYWLDRRSPAMNAPEEHQDKRELAPYLLLQAEPDTAMKLSCPQPDGTFAPGEARINRYRFRYGDLSKKKPENTLRIFLIGGSVVFNGPSNETTISGYLEDLLKKKFQNKGMNAQAVNAGMTAYISTQELILLITQIVDFDPDIVMVLDGYNDCLIPFSGQDERLGYPYGFKTMEGAWYQTTAILKGMREFSLPSHLLYGSHFLRRINPNWSYSHALAARRMSRPSDESVEKASVASAAELLTQNWNKMKIVLKGKGIKGLFALQPLPKEGGVFTEFYDTVEAKIKEKPLDESDYSFVNLRLFLRDRLDLFYDEIHTYDEGNALYAERLL